MPYMELGEMHEHWTHGTWNAFMHRKITRVLLGSIKEDQNNFSGLEEAKFASSLGGSCGHLLVICPFLIHFCISFC